MSRYLITRLVQLAITMWVIVTLVFLVARAVGDPVNILLTIESSIAEREILRERLGLDQPLLVQYGQYMGGLLRADFGRSYQSGLPVDQLLRARLPNSARLATVATVLGVVVALPLGVVAAVKRGGIVDRASRVVALLGQAVPTFIIGLVLILIFSVWLGVLPTGRMGGIRHYILPAITLGWVVAAGTVRLLRSAMIEAMASDYVTLARSKGLSELRVVCVHALRTALVGPVTFVALYFGLLVGSAIVVEIIFNWPGVGSLAYQAITSRDLPLIQGVVIVAGAVVVLANFVADALYAVIDPRVRDSIQ